jgi:hypothetical protein
MDIKELKFAIREVVSPTDKETIFQSVRASGGVVTMARRDIDGGEIFELTCGEGKGAVKLQWLHWAPQEPPIMMIASNDVKALVKVVSTIAFSQSFFDELGCSIPGGN